MKGFETGIFLRTKGGKVEEYGCSAPDDADNQVSMAIEMIRTAIINAKDGLPDEPMLHEALAMIYEFLGSVKYFIVILGNANADMYCSGLIFGNQGSKLLVKFANVLINPVGKDGEIIPTQISAEERKRRKGGGGEFDLLKAAGKYFKGLGE